MVVHRSVVGTGSQVVVDSMVAGDNNILVQVDKVVDILPVAVDMEIALDTLLGLVVVAEGRLVVEQKALFLQQDRCSF